MRFEHAMTTISWIPSEAVRGLARATFSLGFTHYDEPPPAELGSDVGATLGRLRDQDRLRFAQRLSAWIEVDDDDTIVAHGCDGESLIGSTTMRVGGAGVSVAAMALPDLCPPPEVGDGWVRFTRTAGGRTGIPAPRAVRRKPFVQLRAPVAWTTVEITLHADGRAETRLAGASPFPRHWVYDQMGALVAKSSLTRFADWWNDAFGVHTPWGDYDEPALVSAAETATERLVSAELMSGGVVTVRRFEPGETLCEQGAVGEDLFVLLDGVVVVEVDGAEMVEIGPGAVLGERAVLEGGRRTSTLRAVTPGTVAVAPFGAVVPGRLFEIAASHRREQHA